MLGNILSSDAFSTFLQSWEGSRQVEGVEAGPFVVLDMGAGSGLLTVIASLALTTALGGEDRVRLIAGEFSTF